MKKINVLAVDDHASVRQAFCTMLHQEPFVEAAYEAYDEDSFKEVLNNHRVDVILLDMRLKGTTGLELLKELKNFTVRPYVIGITGLDGHEVIINLLRAGVNGVVHKLEGFDEIINAIKSVLSTGSYFTKYVRDIVRNNTRHWDDIPSVVLSYKERDFLKALASGLTTHEIAPLFKMTEGSAEKFRLELIRKIGVPNSAALLAFAFRNGIL